MWKLLYNSNHFWSWWRSKLCYSSIYWEWFMWSCVSHTISYINKCSRNVYVYICRVFFMPYLSKMNWSSTWIIIPPLPIRVGGVYWIQSVRLSVRPDIFHAHETGKSSILVACRVFTWNKILNFYSLYFTSIWLSNISQ